MCQDEKPEVSPNQLKFPPALHLEDIGIEVSEKHVMLHQDFISKHLKLFFLRSGETRETEVVCPYCNKSRLVIVRIDPQYADGPGVIVPNEKLHVADYVSVICPNKECNALFFGSNRWIDLD